ncbi:hypothetical protein R2083_05375 [Nitrosomonas sp. Is35]|uniref:hypothetical protein n=1 Tax=Nitrosomonas sp. Is35 TaxID=3080534 RepID=UPI00294AC06A|nr:hypothetical protein [Nitrosomonas sp. Is35]MDV6346946.1 hypothetical protein [Nitrosomonas sp. Is35]
MSEDSNDKNLTKPSGGVPTQINLGPSTSMDLSWLPENERKALLIDYTKGMMDISIKAQELHVDAAVLKKTLDDLSDTTREVSDSGNAVTITHSQTTKVGRTEVMMGNTEQAQSGKLSKSQTGEKDWTPYYIFGGILALIIIAALMKG